MPDKESEIQNPALQSPTASGSSVLECAVNIFVSPGEALRSLHARPSFLFPLLVAVISTVLVYAWYFQFVDYGWYVDDMVSSLGEMSDEQQERIREALGSQSQTMMTVTSTLAGAFGILFMYTLQAGYLALVSALTGDGYRFRHWFSLINWTSLPYLLVVLVMAVNILLSPNGQLSLYDANSLSLASLGIPAGESRMLQSMLQGMNLPMFWSFGLTIMGYQQWVKTSYLRAIFTVLAPYMVIFGSLAYFALT